MKQQLTLTRTNGVVMHEGVELKINAQASKGANREVVKIAGLPGAGGQTWLSLSKIKEGTHIYACSAGANAGTTLGGALTPDEQKRVDDLQAQIDAIKAAARARAAATKIDPKTVGALSDDAKRELIAQLQKSLGLGA